jgi:xylulokinase
MKPSNACSKTRVPITETISRPAMTILAVDVGTSSLKAALYSAAGVLLATASRRYSYQTPQPGWAEADPADWWKALAGALTDLRAAGHDLSAAQAIAFTGQMHTVVLLDAAGRVLPPTILWLDRRADQETAELQARLRLPPYQLNSTYSLPKLVWLYRHRPDVIRQARHILWPKDYLRYRLTGELCTDRTEAGGAALLDWETGDWALERLALAGLQPEVLPAIRPAAGAGGRIRPDVAQELRLSPEIRVVVGMGDVAALFGGAPARPGRVVCSLGSSSMVFAPLPAGQTVRDPAQRLYVYPLGPYPMLGGVSSTTGASVVWAYEKIIGGPARNLSFEQCVAAAMEIEAGSGGLCFIPYLAGERSPYWSDALRGGFYGLQLSHDDRYLLRAVLEGVAYSLLHLLDIYAELGMNIDEVALAAGGALTAGWPQMIADVCRRPVRVYAGQETVTRVLYALCQQHLGAGDFESSLLQTFAEPTTYTPAVERAEVYAAGYARYRALSAFAAQQAGVPLDKEKRL